MDEGITNQGGNETSENTGSLQAKQGTARQMDNGQKIDGLNNEALRKKYGHLRSRAEIFGLINRNISPHEAEILLLDLEIETRKELRHNTGLEVCN